MLVKASGFRLSDITATRGLVPVDYPALRSYYQNCDRLNDLTTQITANDAAVSAATLDTSFRPSIETGFHAILGEVVLHTHAVMANILTCSHEGQGILEKLFPGAHYISYQTPGVALTLAILEAQKKFPAEVLFLENHGIITTGEIANEADTLHADTLKKIAKYLHLTEPTFQIAVHEAEQNVFAFSLTYTESILGNIVTFLHTLQHSILFPDQAVYTNHIDHNEHRTAPLMYSDHDTCFYAYGSAGFALAAAETLQAWIYLYETIHELGFTHRTLSIHEGNFISNLDSEKYRKKIA